MARINIHVPDELAEQLRGRGMNVSAICQRALRAELVASTGIVDELMANLDPAFNAGVDRDLTRALLTRLLEDHFS